MQIKAMGVVVTLSGLAVGPEGDLSITKTPLEQSIFNQDFATLTEYPNPGYTQCWPRAPKGSDGHSDQGHGGRCSFTWPCSWLRR